MVGKWIIRRSQSLYHVKSIEAPKICFSTKSFSNRHVVTRVFELFIHLRTLDVMLRTCFWVLLSNAFHRNCTSQLSIEWLGWVRCEVEEPVLQPGQQSLTKNVLSASDKSQKRKERNDSDSGESLHGSWADFSIGILAAPTISDSTQTDGPLYISVD